MSDRPALRALADQAGILSHFVDIVGRRIVTTNATREALLAAMGLDASTERAAHETLAHITSPGANRVLAPSTVTTRTTDRPKALDVRTTLHEPGVWNWSLTVVGEDGESLQRDGDAQVSPHAPLVITTPPLAFGYYDIALVVRHATDGKEYRSTQRHIVTPPACYSIDTALGPARSFGAHVNLYSLKSATNWGAGNLADLGGVIEWMGRTGGDFVGSSPLHAIMNRGDDISPYRPTSRIFRNPLYLHVPAVTDFADCDDARRICRDGAHEQLLRNNREAKYVDYEGVRALQVPVLQALHRHFVDHHAGQDTEAGRAYRKFLVRHGLALHDFATFMALRDHFAETDWRRWPVAYHDPRSAATDLFRREHGGQIDLHVWEQFEMERQLSHLAGRANRAGLRIGLYTDLAIGSAPGGADHWSFPHLFLDDAELGAPPDDYSQDGQNWALPPLDPLKLEQDGYRYWTLLIRSAMESAGAVRLDHVMGLFRQFWIPRGRPASEGAYVAFPAPELLGILALESQRRQTVVVGEDLGTVPEGLSATLERRRILSTKVFHFERRDDGAFRAANTYPREAIVCATTHDNPPLAGFWNGRDLELRRLAGAISTDEQLAASQTLRDQDRLAVLRLLQEGGVLTGPPDDPDALMAAIHRFLAATPCVMASASLDDLCHETDPVNLPGVGLDRYPSWSRRMRASIELLLASTTTDAAIDALALERRR